MYGEVKVELHELFTSAIDHSDGLDLRPDRSTSRKIMQEAGRC
jgi:hypothetical protein